MSIFVSTRFDKKTSENQINTTADFNLVHYLLKMKKDFIVLNNHPILLLSISNIKEIIENGNNIVEYVKNKYNFELKNIVFFDLYHRLPIHTYTCLKHINIYVYIIDNHNDMGLDGYRYSCKPNEFIKKNQLNLLNCYAYNFGAANPKFINFKFNYWLPHSVIHLSKFNENPINHVLVCGRGFKNINRYPYRAKIAYLSRYQSKRANRFHKIHVFKNDVGYRTHPNDTRTWGNNFINLLNSYMVVFCDDGNIKTNFSYIFAKFFEIMSSGALLLTHNKDTKIYFEKLGFKENEDYLTIDLDKNEKECKEQIIEILDNKNKEKINKIRLSGYNKVWKYHSTKERVNDLLNIINNPNTFIEYNDGINGTTYLSKKIFNN